jgi:hypothetical protein
MPACDQSETRIVFSVDHKTLVTEQEAVIVNCQRLSKSERAKIDQLVV